MFANRRWFVAVGLILALLTFSISTAAAQEGANPWQALYWNNINLAGDPAVQRTEAALDHRWGQGAPDPAINPDRFSARWTSNVTLDGGTYHFTATSDDGIRVWVDDQQIIDNWTVHPETVNTADITLSAGVHQIRVDYFENTGQALATLTWEQIGEPGDDPGEETVSISPRQGPAGTTINVQAGGFPANTPVTVGIGVAASEPSVEKQVVTTDAGTLTTTIAVPAEAEAGETWRVLVIRGPESALSGDFTVTAGQGDATPCGDVYIVRPGDWLARIANQCNTTVDALLAANPGITDPNVIRAGQRLVLPGGSDPAAPAVSISPSSGPAGTTVTVNASGFTPNVQATVGIGRRNAEPAASKSVAANNFGALNTTIEVPAAAAPGEPWVVLVSAAGESALSNVFEVTQGAVTATTRFNLRLRAGPGTDTAILDVVPNNTTLEVQGRTEDGEWIRVSYEGQTGWMFAPYTTIAGDLNEVPVSGRFTSANIYLIALEDAGQSGPEVGCGDSVVPVQVSFDATQAPLTAALQQLLAINQQFYGQSGLYNALYQSDLAVEQVTIQDSTATIRLAGNLQVGGACDAPRISAQLRQTALQFDTVNDVSIFVNGQPLDELLSGQ